MPDSFHPRELLDGRGAPARRAIDATTRQAQRARRAEAVRLRQREALLDMLVRIMAELHITTAELNAARRALGLGRRKKPE